ncbi:MAG: inorganic phosphate transporter [Nitrospira sp.]|nr:inorganic phosphate transporter [Nitrospira sp.]
MELLAFFLVLALAYANGSNDVSKSVATLVGSGVTEYNTAILWGTIWTVAGASASAFIGGAMVKTFSGGLVRPDAMFQPAAVLSILTGTIVWILFASRTGLPVSTTHALTGAIVGAGLTSLPHEALIWPAIAKKIALPLLLSPLLALTVSYLLHPGVHRLATRLGNTCVCLLPASRALVTIDAHGGTRTLFQTTAFGRPVADVPLHCERAGLRGLVLGLDTVHWLSSGLASFARGMNDAPKIVAMLLLGSLPSVWPSSASSLVWFGGVALAMGIGSYLGGLRVTTVLAERITTMDHVEGLSANLTTSSLVLLSGIMGLPVSTTHVSSSAIIGIGLRNGMRTIQWRTVRDMVLAWGVTLPATALFTSLCYLVLSPVF